MGLKASVPRNPRAPEVLDNKLPVGGTPERVAKKNAMSTTVPFELSHGRAPHKKLLIRLHRCPGVTR